MSRFGTYLQAQKLAKAHLETAANKLNVKKDPLGAIAYLIQATRELMVANTNLASMQFEKKRTTRKRVSCPHCPATIRGKADLARHIQIVHTMASGQIVGEVRS